MECREEIRLMLLCFIAALAVGGASIVAQGPLPGDVFVTRSLQTLLGSRPQWAEVLGGTAKQPAVLLVVSVACGLVFAKSGRSVVILPAFAYLGALLLNFVLRAIVFVPRPEGGLVEVAKASGDSGLPSTFVLIYASVLGMVVVANGQKAAVARAVTFLAAVFIVVGCISRIVLGGHWLSQVAASLLLAFGFVYWLRITALRFGVVNMGNKQPSRP